MTADLPDEFDHLHAAWVGLKDITLPAAAKLLEGEHVEPSELEGPDLIELDNELGRLEAAYPEIAGPYIEAFRVLEVLLGLLRDRALRASGKVS